MRAGWFLVFVSGFTGGVAFASIFAASSAHVLFLLLLATGIAAYAAVARARNVFLVSLFALGLALGLWRFEAARTDTDPLLAARVGETTVLEGVVSEEADERETHTNLVVDVATVLDASGRPQNADGRVMVVVPRFPTFFYGDRMRISGTLSLPENFTDEKTGRTFNYRSYLAKDGITYRMFQPEMTLLESGKGNPAKAILFKFKNALLHNISRAVPEPESSLLGGLLVGAKHSMPERILEDFKTAGVIHIVVLSGYNLTIVADAVMKFFSFAPRLLSFALGGTSIVLFAVMTGAGATVVRASIMALLALAARATGRTYEITVALVFAGFLMLAHNPRILAFDPSFQLSFIATLGLIYAAPAIEKRLTFLTKAFGLRDIVAATLGTQLAVLPLLLHMTGKLSIVSLPANLLILPLIPLTMLSGFLVGVFGFLGTFASLPFAALAHALLSYELAVVVAVVAVPFAALEGVPVTRAFVAAAYGAYAWWIVARIRRANEAV